MLPRPEPLVDPNLDLLRPLHQIRKERNHHSFVAEGENTVRRLLQSPYPVAAIVCTPSHYERLRDVMDAQRHHGTRCFVTEHRGLKSLVGFDFHRGCIALGPRPLPSVSLSPSTLATLQHVWKQRHSNGGRALTVLFAEQLADPANLGALFRNARAFGVDLVVVDSHGADPWSRRSIRASMGNVFHLDLVLSPDLPATLRSLTHNFHATAPFNILAATVGDRAQSLAKYSSQNHRGQSVALLVGNEGSGLTKTILALADQELTIPMESKADSINVAAATAVLLYALSQR